MSIPSRLDLFPVDDVPPIVSPKEGGAPPGMSLPGRAPRRQLVAVLIPDEPDRRLLIAAPILEQLAGVVP